MLTVIDTVKGSGIPLRGNDIDTDRIIPARFLKCVTFDGLGQNAFADDIAGLEAQGKVHPFRDPKYAKGTVLVSNRNFGCGSSREHAPQALKRWGVRAIIAESYSEIFFGNCVAIGVPCFRVSHEVADKILSWIEEHPSEEIVTSTQDRTLTMGGEVIPLELADGPRGQFLDGSWHARAVLMSHADDVEKLTGKLPYMKFLAR
ncbi:MAG: 3-isopropylmalate dehydratase small subunit [Fibrobacter sp.]|nr:3-isopropylmalate dehydratase small subunit [Fibrobacter sp.]MDY6368221.1 3-isopropylmalate dehydratase small subunit [Fibrobacter sp.]MDY6389638.1 3-isopropylmalate dehydratase small subunit [Fibrobacter sp.]